MRCGNQCKRSTITFRYDLLTWLETTSTTKGRFEEENVPWTRMTVVLCTFGNRVWLDVNEMSIDRLGRCRQKTMLTKRPNKVIRREENWILKWRHDFPWISVDDKLGRVSPSNQKKRQNCRNELMWMCIFSKWIHSCALLNQIVSKTIWWKLTRILWVCCKTHWNQLRNRLTEWMSDHNSSELYFVLCTNAMNRNLIWLKLQYVDCIQFPWQHTSHTHWRAGW